MMIPCSSQVYDILRGSNQALLGQTPSSELPSLAFQFDHVPGLASASS